ncbi:MAG: hypothetical protein WCF20_00435 [Methylovirgula sp.]
MKFGYILGKTASFIKDYYDLLRSGVFMHSAYSKHYFKTKSLLWLSLPHYILIGEKQGYRPNPFFDPAYFKREANTSRLVDYLRQMHLWRYATSDYFDSRWYIERYSACLATTENPLQHFWCKGFDKEYRPSPRFDMKFFLRAIARDQSNRKEYAYNYACTCQAELPLNIIELETRQREFYDDVELNIIKRIHGPRKRFLVFIQAGHNYEPNYAYETTPFDILINYYDDSTRIGDVEYVFKQKGTKTTAIRKILEACPEVFLGYEAVLFLDDDIVISQAQIGVLFDTLIDNKLDLLQASLSEDSECYFPILKQPIAGTGLRPLSGIEIMMPVVSRRALRECGWVFEESISGWCVDALLSAEVRKRFGNTIALLGDVVAVHARPVDTNNNAFYKFLNEHGVNPTVEAGKIAMKFGLNDKMSAVDFRILEPKPSEILLELESALVETTIFLRYADRLDEATLDHQLHRVTGSRLEREGGGGFLSDGKLLTIHWDRFPAESFFRQGDEYVHITMSKDRSATKGW